MESTPHKFGSIPACHRKDAELSDCVFQQIMHSRKILSTIDSSIDGKKKRKRCRSVGHKNEGVSMLPNKMHQEPF